MHWLRPASAFSINIPRMISSAWLVCPGLHKRIFVTLLSGSRKYSREFIEHVSLYSLAQLPSGSRSLNEIYKVLREELDLPLELENVLGALRSLEEKGKIYVPPSVTSDADVRFGLTPESTNELRDNVKAQEEFEQSILVEWEDYLHSKYEYLTDEDLGSLKEDLSTFSFHLYTMHSAESVAMIVGEESATNTVIEAFDSITLNDILPKRDKALGEIRSIELPKFFIQASEKRKLYIANHLNPIFALHMIQLDKDNAKLVSEKYLGGTIYLDTNVLFRLFGLDGAELQSATRRLISLSRGLNFKIAVSPMTVQEYNTTLQKRGHNARGIPPIPLQVAQTALETTYTRNMDTALWQKSIDTGGRLSPHEYFHLFSDIDALLNQYDISIISKGHDFILSNDKELTKEMGRLVNSLRWKNYNPDIIRHDAYHRLLILHLRQGYEADLPLKTNNWFLTTDTKLATYDHRVRKSENIKNNTNLNIPFCVATSNWMQMLSPYRGAVEGFELAQVEQLDSPLFRIFPSPNTNVVNSIITRMTAMDQFGSEVTAHMIAKDAFRREFANAQSKSEQDVIYEKHVNSELFEKLRTENTTLHDKLDLITENINTLEEKYEFEVLLKEEIVEEKEEAHDMLKLYAEELDRLETRLENIEKSTSPEETNWREKYESALSDQKNIKAKMEKLSNEIIQLKLSKDTKKVENAADSTSNENVSDEESEIKQENRKLKQELEKQRRKNTYIYAFLFEIIGIIAIIVILIEPSILPWLETHSNRIGLIISGIAIWSCMAIIIAKDEWKRWGVGGILLAFFSIIPQIIDP